MISPQADEEILAESMWKEIPVGEGEAWGASTSWDAGQKSSSDGLTFFCKDLAEVFARAETLGVRVDAAMAKSKNEEVQRLALAYRLAKSHDNIKGASEEVNLELSAVRQGVDAAYVAYKGQNLGAYMAACERLPSVFEASKFF